MTQRLLRVHEAPLFQEITPSLHAKTGLDREDERLDGRKAMTAPGHERARQFSACRIFEFVYVSIWSASSEHSRTSGRLGIQQSYRACLLMSSRCRYEWYMVR